MSCPKSILRFWTFANQPVGMGAVGTAETGIEGTAEIGTEGTTEMGAVGIAEMGVVGATAEGIPMSAVTPGPSKVSTKHENRHANKGRLQQRRDASTYM